MLFLSACCLCSLFLADFQIPSNLEEAGSWNIALVAMVQDSNHIMPSDRASTWGPHDKKMHRSKEDWCDAGILASVQTNRMFYR